MRTFSPAEIEAQTVLDLPERELLDATITISGNSLDVSVLENLLNQSFNNYSIFVADFNNVTVNVKDNVSRNDLDVFCNQVVAVLSAQCDAQLV